MLRQTSITAKTNSSQDSSFQSPLNTSINSQVLNTSQMMNQQQTNTSNNNVEQFRKINVEDLFKVDTVNLPQPPPNWRNKMAPETSSPSNWRNKIAPETSSPSNWRNNVAPNTSSPSHWPKTQMTGTEIPVEQLKGNNPEKSMTFPHFMFPQPSGLPAKLPTPQKSSGSSNINTKHATDIIYHPQPQNILMPMFSQQPNGGNANVQVKKHQSQFFYNQVNLIEINHIKKLQ